MRWVRGDRGPIPPGRPEESAMAKWSMEDALRLALRLEEENFEEYEKNAGEAANPGVKAMFRFLAGEERNHIRLIKEKMAQFNIKP
jgi:rubrerythrin